MNKLRSALAAGKIKVATSFGYKVLVTEYKVSMSSGTGSEPVSALLSTCQVGLASS